MKTTLNNTELRQAIIAWLAFKTKIDLTSPISIEFKEIRGKESGPIAVVDFSMEPDDLSEHVMVGSFEAYSNPVSITEQEPETVKNEEEEIDENSDTTNEDSTSDYDPFSGPILENEEEEILSFEEVSEESMEDLDEEVAETEEETEEKPVNVFLSDEEAEQYSSDNVDKSNPFLDMETQEEMDAEEEEEEQPKSLFESHMRETSLLDDNYEGSSLEDFEDDDQPLFGGDKDDDDLDSIF